MPKKTTNLTFSANTKNVNSKRPLVTVYIETETKIPHYISSILTKSVFYTKCMKPLLNLKNVQVKRAIIKII